MRKRMPAPLSLLLTLALGAILLVPTSMPAHAQGIPPTAAIQITAMHHTEFHQVHAARQCARQAEPSVFVNYNDLQRPARRYSAIGVAPNAPSPSTPRHEMSRARTLNRGYMLHFAPAP